MAQRGNIAINDGAVTPVVHTYFPTQSADGLISWRDRTNAVYIGQNRLTVEQRLANRATKATKLSWKLETPVLEQTSTSTATGVPPPPTVAYTPLIKIEIVLPDRCSLQERKDALAQARNLFASALVTTQVHDLDLIF